MTYLGNSDHARTNHAQSNFFHSPKTFSKEKLLNYISLLLYLGTNIAAKEEIVMLKIILLHVLALAAPTCAFIKLDPRISSTSLMTTSTVTEISETTLPDWTSDFGRSKEKLIVGEWDDDEDSYDSTEYRRKGGWKGTDFMHSKNSAVRVLRYYADYKKDSVGTSLEGIVEFTPNAESHSGYCHGKSSTVQQSRDVPFQLLFNV